MALDLVRLHNARVDSGKQIEVKGYVDLSKAKKEFASLPVSSPDIAVWEPGLLVAVSPSNYLSVMKTLAPILPQDTELLFLWQTEFFDPRDYEHVFGASETVAYTGTNESETGSGQDLRGSIYFEQNRTLRRITKQEASFYESLFDNPSAIEELLEMGLVPTKKIEHERQNFVIEHESLIAQSPKNWSPEMFKSAALFFLGFWRGIISKGYSLQDLHSGNVMFRHGQPLFVDFCSIGPREATTVSPPFLQSFFDTWIHPLALIASEQNILLYELLRRSSILPFSSIEALCTKETLSEIHALHQSVFQLLKEKDLAKITEELETWVEKVTPSSAYTGWNRGGYQAELEGSVFPTGKKEEAINEILLQHTPASVLDIGCNNGRFSVAAARGGAEVLALDYAERLLDQLFEFQKQDRLSILPLVYDISELTPFTAPARSFDVTLALAVIHHWVFVVGWSVEAVLETLNALSNSVLVIEFIHPVESEPFLFERFTVEAGAYYSTDYIMSWLKERFSTVVELELHATRCLIIATRESC